MGMFRTVVKRAVQAAALIVVKRVAVRMAKRAARRSAPAK